MISAVLISSYDNHSSQLITIKTRKSLLWILVFIYMIYIPQLQIIRSNNKCIILPVIIQWPNWIHFTVGIRSINCNCGSDNLLIGFWLSQINKGCIRNKKFSYLQPKIKQVFWFLILKIKNYQLIIFAISLAIWKQLNK